MRKRYTRFVLTKKTGLVQAGVFFLISSVMLNLVFAIKNMVPQEGDVTVIDVIDGDTLVSEDRVRVRLTAVDAPELNLCMGMESKEYLSRLVMGRKIDIKSPAADGFGRLIGLVFVGDRLINEEMLRAGMGRFGGGNAAKREILKAASDEARKNKSGVFSGECYQIENADNHGCLIKGNKDKNDGKKHKYHFPGCAGYNVVAVEKDLGDEWFCSEKEAGAAGYVKSEQCYGKSYQKGL